MLRSTPMLLALALVSFARGAHAAPPAPPPITPAVRDATEDCQAACLDGAVGPALRKCLVAKGDAAEGETIKSLLEGTDRACKSAATPRKVRSIDLPRAWMACVERCTPVGVPPRMVLPDAHPNAPVDLKETPVVLPAGATMPVRLGELVPEAYYPEAARSANIEGTVMVKVIIQTDGTVLIARFIKSDPNFDEAVRNIVRTLRYKPATLDGKPIAVYQNLRFPFVID